MPNPDKKMLRETFLEIVDNQLRNNTPPETSRTYDRLKKEGYSDQEARELIAAAVSSEMFDILKSQQPFNEKRYIATLQKLPRMPWE